MNKCQICKNKVEVFSDWLGSIHCEESYMCSKCGYSFEYAYGFTRIKWGNFFTVEYGYTDTNERVKYNKIMIDRYDRIYKVIWRVNKLFNFLGDK